MATGAAAAAAAAGTRARRNVISHFLQLSAVSAATAVAWVPERRIERRVLARLVERGVIVAVAADRYYLDPPGYDRWRRTVRKQAVLALLAVAIATLAVAAIAVGVALGAVGWIGRGGR